MKFNPNTKTIYTDDGELIKKLNCPKNKQWDNLITLNEQQAKMCDSCNHLVLDTATLSNIELSQIIKHNPNTCFKVSVRQSNLTIITDDIF